MTSKRLIFAILSIILALVIIPNVALAQSPRTVKSEVRSELKERLATKTGILQMLKGKKAVLKEAELLSIDGTKLTVTKDGKNYTVLTDDKTKLRRKYWGVAKLSEFTAKDKSAFGKGDLLNIRGSWEDENQTTIKALFVRNLSIQKRNGVFFGTVTAKTDTGFTMNTVVRGAQTVTIDASTKYINRKQQTIGFSDLATGQKVRVRGLWDSLNATITEVTQIKDFSLPPQASSRVSSEED